MKLNQKNFTYFHDTLSEWYDENRRSLPWRKKHPSAYHVWVSEIMLQQTQVSRVTEYYTRFLKKFPTIHDLAESSWDSFLPYYEGLGYYTRGRNMLQTAKIIVTKHDGKFPVTKKELLKLSGIGDYTADAILAFAYDKSTIAWDVNVKRVSARYFYGGKTLKIEKEKIEKYFANTKKASGRDFNSALMDLGSLVCVARPKRVSHAEICPFGKKCQCFSGVTQFESGASKRRRKKSMGKSVCLCLHKDHREYYSGTKTKFSPFFLPKDVCSRNEIKEYFIKKYGLTLSVRPPNGSFVFKGEPHALVNAQILSGKNPFSSYPKKAVQNFFRNDLRI